METFWFRSFSSCLYHSSVISICCLLYIHVCGGLWRNINIVNHPSPSCEEEVSRAESAIARTPSHTVLPLLGEPTGCNLPLLKRIGRSCYRKIGTCCPSKGDNTYRYWTMCYGFVIANFPKESSAGSVKMSQPWVTGTQHNVIPDRCTFILNIRNNECYSNREPIRWNTEAHPCEAKTPLLPRKLFTRSSNIR